MRWRSSKGEGRRGELAELAAAEPARRRAACEAAAGRLREDPSLREPLLELLRTGDPATRLAAAWVLVHGGRPDLRLLPALLNGLELAEGDLRWSAVQLLALLGRLHPEVRPVLTFEAQDGHGAQRRRMAIYALRELAPEQPETHLVMLRALGDEDPEVRRAALSSFGKLRGPGQECAERVLAIAACDPDPRMRRIATVVLPALAAASPAVRQRALDLLESLSREPDPSLARAALAARRRLDASG